MTSDASSDRRLLQTRVHPAVRQYLKRYAKLHGVPLEEVAADIVSDFIRLRPDQHGLAWRTPLSHRGETGAQQGWVQFNVWLPNELASQVVGVAMETAQTRAVVLYTALFWFVRYLCPPPAQTEDAHASHTAQAGAA